MDSYSLVLWPLVASLTREPEHFPSWTRNGHEYRAFSLRRRTQYPWYGQHNIHMFPNLQLCKFVILPTWDAQTFILLLSCTLRNFCNSPGFPFSPGGGDPGDTLVTVHVGGRLSMHWGCDLGMLAVPLLLQPCETESGSWLSPKKPQKSQCFLLTPCPVTFAHMLHHTPSVLSRTWTTNKFQNQFVVSTEIFLSVLKGLYTDKVAKILSYLQELSINSPSRQKLFARASADKQKQRWHSKKKLFYLSLALLQHYFRKSWMQILHECNCRFQEIT